VSATRVYVTRELPGAVLRQVAAADVEIATPGPENPDADELRAEAARSDAIVVTISERLDAAFFAGLGEAHRLRVVSAMSTGIDHIDSGAAERAGVDVLRLPGSVTEAATAELTWALVLAAARGILPAVGDLRAGRWAGFDPWQWTGLQLDGATLGIVGFGAIGRRVARYAAAFGMETYCATRTVPEHPEVRFVELAELAPRCDVVTLHVPLTPATRGLIDAAFLERVRPGTVLINTSRGGVVDERAVLDALDSGRLAAAGLDVYAREPASPDGPLVRHPRVLALPHIGSATKVTRVEMAVRAVRAAVTALRQ
jgi:glyoxylate reductase